MSRDKLCEVFKLGSISAALSCPVYVPLPESGFGGGARAPFPNSGW